MSILFVASGAKKNRLGSVVLRQYSTMVQSGLDVDVFLIKNGGFLGYCKSIIDLRRKLANSEYSIIHSHYSFSAFVSTISLFGKTIPHVVSLMGSDLQVNIFTSILYNLLSSRWSWLIVKSLEMKNSKLARKHSRISIIPNGVDLDQFIPIHKQDAQKKLGWDCQKFHILFASDPIRPEKNFFLTNNALSSLKIDYELHFLKDVSEDLVVYFYNASDLVILSSLREGSPNVIKESLACNRAVLSTNVGDVKENFDGVEGVFISELDINDFTEKLNSAIRYSLGSSESRGRARIIELGLDKSSITTKIEDIYKQVTITK